MAIAVAGVVASITVGTSLRHLVDTPREQGWNWDVIVGNPNSVSLAGDPASAALHQSMVQSLSGNRDVAAFAGFAPVPGSTVDGLPVGLVAIEPQRGPVYLDHGRGPTGRATTTRSSSVATSSAGSARGSATRPPSRSGTTRSR